MTKEQLIKIKNGVIHTLTVLDKEKESWDTNSFEDIFFKKLDTIQDKVLKLCNNNQEIAIGIMKIAVEEYARHKVGDYQYDLIMAETLNELKNKS